MQETSVLSLDWEDLLEKEMAIHLSTLAWKILSIEEPGGLQSMASQSQTQVSTAQKPAIPLCEADRKATTVHGYVITFVKKCCYRLFVITKF